jgi:hypothetical protein
MDITDLCSSFARKIILAGSHTIQSLMVLEKDIAELGMMQRMVYS